MRRGKKAVKLFPIWHFYWLFWDWLANIAMKRLIKMTDWLRYWHGLVFYALSTGAILKGLTPRKSMSNVGVLTVCFGLYLCRDWLCGFDLRRVYMHEKSMCLLMTKLDHPDGTLYIKILLRLLLLGMEWFCGFHLRKTMCICLWQSLIILDKDGSTFMDKDGSTFMDKDACVYARCTSLPVWLGV